MPNWVRAGNIGARLCEVRLALGMTQGEFGALMGVTDQSVSDYEVGRSAPGQARLQRLANDLQVPVAVFSEGGPMPSTVPIHRPGSLPEPRIWHRDTPGAPEDPDLLRALLARLEFLRDQIKAYRTLGQSPSPAILEEWLRLTADLDEPQTG